MARRDIRINGKGFILVFVSPYCNKKHKGWISVFVFADLGFLLDR